MSAAYYPQVQEIYVAYYGRPADPAGLQYWAGQLAANKGNLASIINAFGNSAESTALYAGASNSAKVTAIYQQIFNRAPDSAGLTFYTNALTAGTMTAASIALNVADGASGVDATYLANKLVVAQAFSDALTTDSAANLAYSGTTAITAARSLITGVTTSAATTNVASTITSIKSGGGSVAGQTFTLTTGTDTFAGTTGSDTFTAASGTLNATDVILDFTTTDSDVLNATVTSNSIAARIQNIETLNVTGRFVTTGLALTNVSGVNDLNLDTTLQRGSAAVTDANSLNATNINAGDKIASLSVTSLASGTRDTVTIDANAAATVNITGVATGADTYVATVAADATVTLATFDSLDSVTLNLGGDVSLASVAALGDLVINAESEAAVVALTVGSAADTLVTGSKDVTIQATSALFDTVGLTTTSSGVVTLEVTDITNDDLLNEAVVDVVTLTDTGGANNDTLTVNENSTVNITVDLQGAGDTFNLDVDNVDADLAVGGGTLLINVSESQTATLAIGDDAGTSNAGTVILTATPDEDSDTADGAEITLFELDTNTNGADVTALIIQGAANLTITTLTNVAASVVSAADMTGDLTIGATTATVTIELGSGDDTVTTGNFATSIYGGAGNDTLTMGNALNSVYGEDGDDTIDTGTINETISGGAGDDLIVVAANSDIKTVSLGSGADTVRLVVDAALDDATDEVNISDFVFGTDTLLLHGVSTDTTINLTSITPSSGVYTIAAGDFVVTLTGNTGSDLSGSVQLGTSEFLFTAASGATVVAGDLDDSITVAAANSATLTLGDGDDVVFKTAGAGVTTVTDFVLGEDKVVLIGASTDALDLSAAATVGTGGAYNVNTTSDEYQFTLTDMTSTDLAAFVQLGDKENAFTADANAGTVGGDFDDYISITGTDTNTGASSIEGGLGADRVTFGGGGDKETLVVAAGDSLTTAWDELTGYESNATANLKDILNLDSTNIATVIGATAVSGITGVTVSNGVITDWAGIDDDAGTVDASMLAAAIAFLSANVGGTDTVAFGYTSDENGDGDTSDTGETSTFVFQNGTTETLVELIGLSGMTRLVSTATTSTTEIVIA